MAAPIPGTIKPLSLTVIPEPIPFANETPVVLSARSLAVSMCCSIKSSPVMAWTDKATSCKDSACLVAVTVTSSTVCDKTGKDRTAIETAIKYFFNITFFSLSK